MVRLPQHGQVNNQQKEQSLWFHMARGDLLSENTDSDGVLCEREQKQTYPGHRLYAKNTRWNADIAIHCYRFQQSHSSINKAAATLFNQP